MEGFNLYRGEIFELIVKSGRLPEPSRKISEILEMLNNPVELDIDNLVMKISEVNQLNELMINNLNRGYFRINKEIKTIKEAIIYLGMQTVQNLLIFFITQQLFLDVSPNNERSFNIKQYNKHVLGTSVASNMLSTELGVGDKYKLFSYGLIHDIGIAVLDTCVPEVLEEIIQKLKMGMHQIVAESLLLGGITHAEVGAWICKRWKIREDITNIVEFHHRPFLTKANTIELKLMYIADAISTEYYEKLLGVNLNHRINKQVMDSLGVTESQIQIIKNELPGEIEKADHYFM